MIIHRQDEKGTDCLNALRNRYTRKTLSNSFWNLEECLALDMHDYHGHNGGLHMYGGGRPKASLPTGPGGVPV